MERPKREGIMLAYHVDEGKLKRLGEEFFIQPKLNGERCRVEWFNDEPVLLSSYNNIFPHLQHIKDTLLHMQDYLGVGPCLDGELYVHGWPRERIDSAVRCPVNRNPENSILEFHVFDTVSPTSSQLIRLQSIHKLLKNFRDSPIKEVPVYTANQESWIDAASEFVDQGYEGLILRSKMNFYTPKRTVEMLKFKPTEHDSYLIVNVLEAISQDGDPKGMVGAFSVMDADGRLFDVGAGKLNHSERTSLWQNHQSIIGRQLLVKHEKLKTAHGVPVCAVAVEVKK